MASVHARPASVAAASCATVAPAAASVCPPEPSGTNQAPGRIVVLKQRQEFLAAAADGRRWVHDAFILQCAERPQADGAIGVGFTATKKLGTAVVRNRAKRRLRAAMRDVLPVHGCPDHNFVVIARAPVLTIAFAELCHALVRAVCRVPTARPRSRSTPKRSKRGP